ncbi:MAG: type II/IV secretion system protein [Candidatus Berkelbacteria bacterium]|nr:type II/IV secretion system protein [Candidatus Berkelbacteria bacterium]
MALTVLPQLTNPARLFVNFLIKRHLIKDGFGSILGNRDFPEIDEYLLAHKLIEPDKLAEQYAAFYGLPFERLINRPILPSVLNLLPGEIALKYVVVPYKLEGTNLYLAVGEPSRLQKNAPSVLAGLHRQKGLQVHLAIVPRSDVEAVLHKSHDQGLPIAQTTPQTIQKIPPHLDISNEVQSLNKQDLIKEVGSKEREIDLKGRKIPLELLQKIPLPVAKRYQMVVFDQESPKGQFEQPMIKIAMVNPDDPKTREIINYIENRNKVLVDRYHTSLESLNEAFLLYPSEEHHEAEAKIEEEKEDTKSPVKTAVPVPPPPTPAKKTSVTQPIASTASAPSEAIDTHATTKVQGVTEGMSLSSDDIVNRPSMGETTEELQRLAKQQENSLESQNLDSLLKGPVTSVEELAKSFRNGVIPEIVAATLFLAIRMKASDVHIEALVNAVRLRFRIDGILHDIISVPHFLHAPLISRIKILAKMKIDEQRIPQDGRFDVIIDNRQVDLRVSTMPTVHGEKIVMRLLDKSGGVMTLEQLGVTGTNFDTLIANIAKPYGIIMSTGPTGSGKSTTLYAALTRLSKPGVNIITLEDPVEYELPGVNQAQVKPQIGFTFAEGLRSVLRQDPNIIMVGEIRDLETAAMATHAALTGHLVLTTLHTNDAAGALPRLINMGVEPFLITSSLNAVIGQRLVRKICDKCREKATIPTTLLETIKRELSVLPSGQMKNININQLIFYHGKGCKECNNGYSGRIGIFEVLQMSSRVEELAVRKAPTSEIKKAAIADGMITMIQDGLLKALKGITTVDEVMRVTTTHTKEVPGAGT